MALFCDNTLGIEGRYRRVLFSNLGEFANKPASPLYPDKSGLNLCTGLEFLSSPTEFINQDSGMLFSSHFCFDISWGDLKGHERVEGVNSSPSLCLVLTPLFWRRLIIIAAVLLSFSHWISTSLANGMTRENCSRCDYNWMDWLRQRSEKNPSTARVGDKKETIHYWSDWCGKAVAE